MGKAAEGVASVSLARSNDLAADAELATAIGPTGSRADQLDRCGRRGHLSQAFDLRIERIRLKRNQKNDESPKSRFRATAFFTSLGNTSSHMRIEWRVGVANRGKGREWVILVAPMAGRGRTWLKAPVPSVMSRQPILDADPLIAGPRKGLEWTRTSSRPRQRRPEALESTVAPPARKSIRGTCTLSYRPCKPSAPGTFRRVCRPIRLASQARLATPSTTLFQQMSAWRTSSNASAKSSEGRARRVSAFSSASPLARGAKWRAPSTR